VLASELARFLLRFAWHLTSVTWAVLALTLIQLVRDAATARWWAAASTGVVFTAVGLFDAIYSRGRHAGWPLLAGIGLAALLSLAMRAGHLETTAHSPLMKSTRVRTGNPDMCLCVAPSYCPHIGNKLICPRGPHTSLLI
jgi:hypothetical protein